MKKVSSCALVPSMLLAGSALFFLCVPALAKERDRTPPVISNVEASSTSPTEATVTWDTDEPADSNLSYGISPHTNNKAPGSTALVVSHSISIAGLTPGISYDFCASSEDADSNKAEACGSFTTTGAPPPPGHDKTPPVISNMHATVTQPTEATVTWDTDEPADSDIKYGISPQTNINGTSDAALVVSHTMLLAGLTSGASYDFCVLSRDDANNKAESCGSFLAVVPPSPAPSGTGGGGTVSPSHASVSGFAYPGVQVFVMLRGIFFGSLLSTQTLASSDGSFSASFSSFPQGPYILSVSAYDKNGILSVVKQFQFDFSSGDAPLVKQVVMPPTIALVRDAVARGDDLKVFGYAAPLRDVLVEVGGIEYETASDAEGAYSVLVNTARLPLHTETVRARLRASAGVESDYSVSKSFTIVENLIPQADLNHDGTVDIKDLSIFFARPIDITGDSKVDSADLSVLLRAFSLIPFRQ